MWQFQSEKISSRTIKYQITDEKNKLSFQQVIDLWKSSSEFGVFFNSILKECSFEAFFWEVKPVISSTLDEAFEFVLVESSALATLNANKFPFAKYLLSNDSDVVVFPNLGKDALLVVPNEIGQVNDYTHIANFVRNASRNQVVQLWKKVGEVYEKEIGQNSKWLSTSGLGVAWLHIRIDSKPKYYQYKPYKNRITH